MFEILNQGFKLTVGRHYEISVAPSGKEGLMGWVSPYGCPEDGQQAFDSRAQSLDSLSKTISEIKNNFDL
jgi:hypothetical protein